MTLDTSQPDTAPRVVDRPLIERPLYGPGSGNHARREILIPVAPSYNDLLRECINEQEVTDTLLALAREAPHASAGTRRKWHRTAELVRQRIRVDALAPRPLIVQPCTLVHLS